MKIGLLGLTYFSGNKGCEALSYSFLEALNRIAKKENTVLETYLITVFPTKFWLKNGFSKSKTARRYRPVIDFPHLKNDCIYFKKIAGKYHFGKKIRELDCVFDFTYGDSFTDIYGIERFNSYSAMKNEIIKRNIPLILGSQTIGPFNDDGVRKTASEIILAAKEVYVRDRISYDYTVKISERKPLMTTDIAFLLPFNAYHFEEQKKRIGFNPSGLLWNGGYTRDNQFGLTTDYREYCRRVISGMLNNGSEVHLILHAYNEDRYCPDNDLIAVEELHKQFPETVVSPYFKTPMEAKGYIASMDAFIGARMHATIGSFSAGVPVIPFSYSRKFEGLFNSLEYNYVINGCKESTEDAVKKTLMWISDIPVLKRAMEKGEKLVCEKSMYLLDCYEDTLIKCKKAVDE